MNNSGFIRRVQNFFGGGANEEGRSGSPQQQRQQQTGNVALDDLLSSVLGGFRDFEAAATQAAVEASLREVSRQPQGSPPASTNAIKNLPLIQIKREDLVDPVNRECCVCLEAHVLSGTAVRLPCAHIFHKECILDWLKGHCTCPVCRYELPTDDADFERQRRARMRNRRPRYARHELERLSIKELKRLLPQGDHYHAVDRADLVDHVITSGAIDLIAAPEPVEYSLSALRQMTISQLKRCMNEEAGVFFDPIDVIEKDDMIRIFISSGRLAILPEDEELNAQNRQESASTASEISSNEISSNEVRQPCNVETVMEVDSYPQPDLRIDKTLIMEECSAHDQQLGEVNGPDGECFSDISGHQMGQTSEQSSEVEAAMEIDSHPLPHLQTDRTRVKDEANPLPLHDSINKNDESAENVFVTGGMTSPAMESMERDTNSSMVVDNLAFNKEDQLPSNESVPANALDGSRRPQLEEME